MAVIMLFMIIVMVIMIVFVIIVIFIMIIVVIIGVNLAVKVFGFTPNQSRPNGSFDRERTTICEAPLKDTAKDAIDGVVLGIPLKVGVKPPWPSMVMMGVKSNSPASRDSPPP